MRKVIFLVVCVALAAVSCSRGNDLGSESAEDASSQYYSDAKSESVMPGEDPLSVLDTPDLDGNSGAESEDQPPISLGEDNVQLKPPETPPIATPRIREIKPLMPGLMRTVYYEGGEVLDRASKECGVNFRIVSRADIIYVTGQDVKGFAGTISFEFEKFNTHSEATIINSRDKLQDALKRSKPYFLDSKGERFEMTPDSLQEMEYGFKFSVWQLGVSEPITLVLPWGKVQLNDP